MTEKTWYETIVCPNCEHVQEAEVVHYDDFVWPIYAHTCTACGCQITESEWCEANLEAENNG